MYKKKWASIALSTMLILSLTIGAGTFALFTSKATNAGNSFHAGTLDLGSTPAPMYYTDKSHPQGLIPYNIDRAIEPDFGGEAEGGWAPGDSIHRYMEITNEGSLDAIVKGVHARINENTYGSVTGLGEDDEHYGDFIEAMHVRIVDRVPNRELFSGSLKELLVSEDPSIGAGGGEEFTPEQEFIVRVGDPARIIDFYVSMDIAAGNNLQEKTWIFDFIFLAEQARNNSGDGVRGTITGYVTGSGDALEGATVVIGDRTATTDAHGFYSISVLAGDNTGTASATGFYDLEKSIHVPSGSLVSLNFDLTPLPKTGTVSGVVKDSNTNLPIVGATVTVEGGESRTTDENGSYSFILEEGSYILSASATGYNGSGNIPVNVIANANSFQDISLQPKNGTVSGVVKHSVKGTGIPSATVKFGTMNVLTAPDNTGAYSIQLPAGEYTVTASKTGLESETKTITVLPDGNHTLDFELIETGDWKITLDFNAGGLWPIVPPSLDLDAHLTLPRQSGSSQREHVYFRSTPYSQGGQVRAALDQDWGDGWLEAGAGTETITISNQFKGENDVYRYYVHNYTDRNKNNSTTLSSSKAKVTIEKGNNSGVLMTFNVPTGKTGNLWSVFTISGNKITTVNTISNAQNENQMPQSVQPGLSSSSNDGFDDDIEMIVKNIKDNEKPEIEAPEQP